MIPSKLPKGTTLEQWDSYEKELQAHEATFDLIKPMDYSFDTSDEYDVALDQWRMEKLMDAPNKPGSEFSNND